MQQYSGLGGVAYLGERAIRGVAVSDARALPSGADTLVAMRGTTGQSVIPSDSVAGAFGVSQSGVYSYQFFIPVLSGATGGNITITLNNNGSLFESWVLSLPSASRVMLSGMNYDPIYVGDVLTVSMNHANGTGWSIYSDAFMQLEVIHFI